MSSASVGEWPLVPLGEITELYDAPHQTAPLSPDGPVTYLNVGDIRNGRIRLSLSGRVSESTAADWTRRVQPREGDVVFGYEAKVGEAAMLTGERRWCLGRRVGLLRPTPDRLDSRFLSYAWYSKHFQDTLRAHRIGGTTIESIRLTDLPRWTIALPPLHEQRRIAGILGALDDKIEMNRRLSETLKSTAAAAFGQTALTASRDCAIGDVADVVDCLHSKKPARRDTGRPLLQLNNIRADGLLDMGDTYLIDESDYGLWASRIEVKPGDCVITNVGRVGAVAQVPFGVQAALGRNMTAVRPRASFPYPTFLLQALLSDDMRDEIAIKTDTGTILDALNVRNIPLLRLPLPRSSELERFERRVRPVRARMEQGLVESSTLASIRDALLPRLLSGDLKVAA